MTMRKELSIEAAQSFLKFTSVIAVCAFIAGCSSSSSNLSVDGNASLGNKGNIASLTQVIKKNPEDPNALNLRGTAYAQIKQYDEAFKDFNAAIAINPNYYQAYNNRALLYYKTRKYDRAMSDYNEAIRLAPKYHLAYIGRGRLHQRMKRVSLALADFSHAIDIYGEHPVAYFQRGLIYQKLGQHENAIHDFSTAINLRPNSSGGPYFARGKSRLELQKYEEAYDDFYVAARSRKGHFKAWSYRGLAAEKNNAPEKAARAYRRALGINPSFKPASEGLRRVSGGSNLPRA
ncbi:MAG: tetratricopeptide repeat protein [Methyloligellaceae bacterium]